MNIEEIDKWLDREYGVSYTGLEELHNWLCDREIEKDKEIERLNNIINKAKVYCEDVIQEHENGEYNVSTTQLAIEEHKKNIISLLNILNEDLENYWRSE